MGKEAINKVEYVVVVLIYAWVAITYWIDMSRVVEVQLQFSTKNVFDRAFLS